jgi:DNA-binding transcriptional ArsR family regulator
MNEVKTESLMQFFKAGGQPERVKILGLLANRPYEVNDILNQHYPRQERLRWLLLSARLLKHVGDTFWRSEVQ